MIAAGILDRRGAHADIHDLAAEIVEHENVADVVATLGNEENAREHVLNERLRAEADNERHDADARERGRYIHAERAQPEIDREEHRRVGENAPRERAHRPRACLFRQLQKQSEHAVADPDEAEMAAQAGQLRRERAQDIAQRAESGGNNQQNGEFFFRFHEAASFCGAVRTVSAKSKGSVSPSGRKYTWMVTSSVCSSGSGSVTRLLYSFFSADAAEAS